MNQFWPTSAKDWLYLIGGISGYIVIAIGFFYRIFIHNKMKQIQKRIFKTNTVLQTQAGKHYHIEAFMDRIERDSREIHEEIGKMDSSVQDNIEGIHRMEMKWLTEISQIKETVKEVQTKLDIVLRRLENIR